MHISSSVSTAIRKFRQEFVELPPWGGPRKFLLTGVAGVDTFTCMVKKRTKYLQVRVKPAEKSQFAAAARRLGLSLSAWARERLLAAARKELKD